MFKYNFSLSERFCEMIKTFDHSDTDYRPVFFFFYANIVELFLYTVNEVMIHWIMHSPHAFWLVLTNDLLVAYIMSPLTTFSLLSRKFP